VSCNELADKLVREAAGLQDIIIEINNMCIIIGNSILPLRRCFIYFVGIIEHIFKNNGFNYSHYGADDMEGL
jgi:hypothetical protein